jgi:hypothetical protein
LNVDRDLEAVVVAEYEFKARVQSFVGWKSNPPDAKAIALVVREDRLAQSAISFDPQLAVGAAGNNAINDQLTIAIENPLGTGLEACRHRPDPLLLAARPEHSHGKLLGEVALKNHRAIRAKLDGDVGLDAIDRHEAFGTAT